MMYVPKVGQKVYAVVETHLQSDDRNYMVCEAVVCSVRRSPKLAVKLFRKHGPPLSPALIDHPALQKSKGAPRFKKHLGVFPRTAAGAKKAFDHVSTLHRYQSWLALGCAKATVTIAHDDVRNIAAGLAPGNSYLKAGATVQAYLNKALRHERLAWVSTETGRSFHQRNARKS